MIFNVKLDNLHLIKDDDSSRHICKYCSETKSYSSNKLTQYIILFVLLLVIISIYYWIGWKRYEDKFIDSIQKSFDLINLIPEEIKNIYIQIFLN